MPAPKAFEKRIRWLENLVKSHKGIKYTNRKKPIPFTDEHKRKIGENNVNKKPEMRERCRERAIELIQLKGKFGFKKGCIPYNKGMRSENVLTEYPIDWKEDLKEVVRKKDDYVCQLCGIHQDELDIGQVKKLDVHHRDYNKDNLNLDNLIALCRNCHQKTNFNRSYWIEYFINQGSNEPLIEQTL